jgi:hypothetical protein
MPPAPATTRSTRIRDHHAEGKILFTHRGRAQTTLAVLIAAGNVGLAVPGAARPDGERTEATEVTRLTGPGSINETDQRYQVKGTDLGIMWTDEQGKIRIAFGDTFGTGWTNSSSGTVGASGTGDTGANPEELDWRSNTLARSRDQDPADGLSFDDFVTDRPGHAKELVPSRKRNHEEISTIPTGGVNIAGRDYLAYMSVRHFGEAGRWTTNYNGIVYSDDDGQTWVEALAARRPNTTAYDDRFQMIAYARRDGFVYAFGTPNGRFGAAYLARVPEHQLLDQDSYEYWTAPGGWQPGSGTAATAIVPGPVGELSVRYNEAFDSWMMMYLDEDRRAIVLRLAPEPTGPWSTPITMASAHAYPSLYGGFLYPASDGAEIYFTMTRFDQYNVALMRATLPRDALAGAGH